MRLYLYHLIVNCFLSVCVFGFTSKNPDGTIEVSAQANTSKRVIEFETQGSAGHHSLNIDWEWSPDIELKWLNSELVIIFQKQSGEPSRNIFEGLCAIVDARRVRTIFLDYVTALYSKPSGSIICYIPKIGRRVKMTDYNHQITFLNLNKIQEGLSSPPLTWKARQEAINAGKYDFSQKESSASFTLTPESLNAPSSKKTFLLAPPVFSNKSTTAGILIGLGDTVDSISEVLLVDFDYTSNKIGAKRVAIPGVDVDLLSEAAHIPSQSGLSIEYNEKVDKFLIKFKTWFSEPYGMK